MSLPQLLKIPSVQAFLMNGDIFDVFEGIAKKHGLPPERSEELLDLCDAVINGDLDLEHTPELIGQAFGVTEDVAKKVAIDMAGYRLLPLVAFLPEIEQKIVDLGGDPKAYPDVRLESDQVAKRLALDEIAAGLQIPLTQVVLKRLSFLLQQYAKKEKTEEALKMYFTRSLNIGGLGLTEEQGTALLAATLPLADTLLEAPKVSLRTAPTPAPVKLDVPVPVTPPKQELEIAPTHELAAEVPLASHPEPIIPPVPPVPEFVVKAPVAMAVATKVMPLVTKTTDPDLDPSELRAPAKKAAAARKLTEGIQDSFATALVTATEAATPILKKNKISEKVFADLADKAIRGLRDIYQTRDIVERDWELKGQDLATLMQAITMGVDAYQSAPQSAAKPVAAGSVPAKPDTEHAELDKRFTKLTENESDGAVAPVRAQLTVGSTSLTTSDGQRKMVDIVSSSRLAGPIEQLGKMSPTEFRRLSSNAAEAGQKVEDLLSALEGTSYEERVKGVLAWRDSPMNQLYLQIAEEALSQGLALPEVSSRRRAAGKESLSPAEIKALALLNAKIRF